MTSARIDQTFPKSEREDEVEQLLIFSGLGIIENDRVTVFSVVKAP